MHLIVIADDGVAGISCVHACAAISRANRPLASLVKRKPGQLQTKRRKDADEGGHSSKKSKPTTTLKRQLRPFTCKYCLQKCHTKRGCQKKKAAEAAEAEKKKAAEAAAKDPKAASQNVTATATASATTTTSNAPQAATASATATGSGIATASATATATASAIASAPAPATLVDVDVQQAEIDLSQPSYSEAENSQKEHEQNRNTPTRPGKLPPRRRSPTPTGSASFNPMEGASEATAARLANFLKFVPTPVFKPPRKK
ncbi:uncharacterized protein LOC107496309 [Arachis duranensis]|uniref:Uncharacterized protein LOC107496309 n=1 Tax=Arachis duranensis TaxID=130453 RepID=A0A6P4DVS2_ARADU|nr:uncharacterized protein LOC107496309 [Arachis duranensis]